MVGGHPNRSSDSGGFGARESGSGADRIPERSRFQPTRGNGNQGRRRPLQSTLGVGPHDPIATHLASMSPSLQIGDALVTACTQATRRAVGYLLDKQHDQGFWWGDLTADTTLESDFVLLELWRHPPDKGV